MLAPEALLPRLRTAWARNRQAWLAGEGRWPLAFSTGAPTQAQVSAHWEAFGLWLRGWCEYDGPGRVEFAERAWPQLGAQRLPQRWCFDAPEAVATALGEAGRWQRARQRYAALLERFPGPAGGDPGTASWPGVLARSFDLLADVHARDFVRLGDVLAWLLAHPASGMYLRQLPIAGVDTKWIEPHRGTLAAWLAALRGGAPGVGFDAVAGLRAAPDRIRVRLLDPALRAVVGGLEDIASPPEAVAALALPARYALVVENLATGLALGELPGAVAFMARGYAVDALERIPWLRGMPIAYWGDIDTHGFAILDRLRSRLPQVQSLMMDEATLLAFSDLWVEEPRQARTLELPRLTAAEARLCAQLASGAHGQRVRLEQERIPWDWAWARVREWLGAAAPE